jgi:hypothetical protein
LDDRTIARNLGVNQLPPYRRAALCGAQTRLKSGELITLKKLGAAIGTIGQELQLSWRKMAFVGGHDQR